MKKTTKTTLAEIKRKAKQGETVSIMILPSKMKPFTYWSLSEKVDELVYEDGKFMVYSHNRNIWNDLASTIHWAKVCTCNAEHGKTLTYYEVTV